MKISNLGCGHYFQMWSPMQLQSELPGLKAAHCVIWNWGLPTETTRSALSRSLLCHLNYCQSHCNCLPASALAPRHLLSPKQPEWFFLKCKYHSFDGMPSCETQSKSWGPSLAYIVWHDLNLHHLLSASLHSKETDFALSGTRHACPYLKPLESAVP